MNGWDWSVIHNCIVHPVIPFTFGIAARAFDYLHDATARLAFGDDG